MITNDKKEYEYDDFSNKTKHFLNAAMDIYSVLKDEELIVDVKENPFANKYTLSDLDKKIVAFFMF